MKLERRIVVMPSTGHGICAEAFAQRVIYRGDRRVTLCAHTESDVRASVLPEPVDIAERLQVGRVVRELVAEFQRALGAER